ncbi:MAG: response regulator [bacterium]
MCNNIKIQKKIISYILLFITLLVVRFFLNKDFSWQEDSYFHIVIDIISSFVALFVGILALVHYYSKRSNTTLFIGCGFLGSAILDIFMSIIATQPFIYLFPSGPSNIIAWHCISCIFLSIFLCMSLITWKFKKQLKNKINPNIIYALVIIFILLNLQYIASIPLPPGYHSTFIFSRIEIFVPSIFFFLALVGYLYKGYWKESCFDHWLILALIINFTGHTFYMTFSNKLFDSMFNMSHVFKTLSYIFVLIGLFISVYSILKQERYNEKRISSILNSMVDCVISINIKGLIESCNPAIENTFGYISTELVGQNISILIPQLTLDQKEKCLIKDGNNGSCIVEKEEFFLPKIIDGKFELTGVQKNGATFPIELGINEIDLGNQLFFTLIIRNITQRKEVEHLKDEFVSMVSHELRTPLTSIRGALGLISSNTIGEMSPPIKELVDIAHSNSIRLVNLINDILDIEKIAAGKMEFKLEQVELINIVKQTIEANKPYAQQFNVKLELKNDLTTAKVLADKNRLIQVITNLLSNAIKFSPPNDIVEISILKNNELICFKITDHGKGIPKKFQNKIFEKFEQADSSDSRKKGGTGLGLSICKAIITKLNGNIWFETEIGKSATFYFDLPEWQEQKIINQYSDDEDQIVLICEDDKDIAFLISFILKEGGFRSNIVYNAEQAKEALLQNNYSVVILDIILPDQDGISLLQELRENEKTKNIPIIVVSIIAEESQEKLNGSIAVIDWINKPIDQNRLLSAVKIAASGAAKNRLHILHIDDNPDVLYIAASILKNTADIFAAKSIDEAKNKLKEENFDLVILDLELSDGNGLDLLPLLNDNNIPVIIFSAYEVDEKIASKVNAVLLKSTTTNEKLLNTVKRLIESNNLCV